MEELRLNTEGVLTVDGVELTHERTRAMILSHIVQTQAGFVLQLGRESRPILVEDTAWFVTQVHGNEDQGFELELSDGTRERLDPSTLQFRPARLTCRVHGGKSEAKFLRAPYTELLWKIEECGNEFCLPIEGRLIPISRVHP